MKPIEFDWKKGTTSIVWESPDMGIVRFHVPGDSDDLPDYRGVCFIKVCYKSYVAHLFIKFLQKLNLGKSYEFKAMVMKDGRPQTKIEHRDVKGYLDTLGLSGYSRRLKGNGVIVKRY